MVWHLAFLFLAVVSSEVVRANRSMTPDRRLFFDRLNTLEMEVVDEKSTFFNESSSDYPFLARILQWEIFKYSPSASSKRQVRGCDFHEVGEKILAPPEPEQFWWSQIQQSFDVCLPSWETNTNSPLMNSVGMLGIHLDVANYPFGRHVVFHMPGSVKVKGFLAMKADPIRRPLVILRSGIFSNAQEFYPERAFFIQLFEQSPFNVLVIESTSGSEFIRHNRSLSFGGFDEGLQTLWIAKLLKDPEQPISRFIDSIHLVGISLGGHGVFVANWLAATQSDLQNQKLFHSSLQFCPLVQFSDTLDFHQAQVSTMKMMNYWASRRLSLLKDRYPDLTEEKFVQDFLGILNSQYRLPAVVDSHATRSVPLPAALSEVVRDRQNLFWKLNNFWPLIDRTLQSKNQSPILVFATSQDPFVPFILNSGRFISQQLDVNKMNIKVFQLAQGYHCSLQVAYDWGLFATIINSFILKNSPNFQVQKKEARFPIPAEILGKFVGREVFLSVDFQAEQKNSELTAEVRYDLQFWPTWKERLAAPSVKYQIPIKELDFPIPSQPSSKAEVRLLERWAQQNIKAQILDSQMIFEWKVAAP